MPGLLLLVASQIGVDVGDKENAAGPLGTSVINRRRTYKHTPGYPSKPLLENPSVPFGLENFCGIRVLLPLGRIGARLVVEETDTTRIRNERAA